MSLSGEQDPTMNPLPPDPLLKPGAFIDPHPISNGQPQPDSASVTPDTTDHQTPEKTSQSSDQMAASDPQADWLPPGWTVVERVRASGASAGTRDKYYVDPVSKRRFRSRKEVLLHLGIDATPLKRKKNAASDADASTPQGNTQTTTPQKRKRKKQEITAEDMVKRFNFDDVPAKVKWELTDVYEATWEPLLNNVETVSEASRQEWAAAFTYLTMPNDGSIML